MWRQRSPIGADVAYFGELDSRIDVSFGGTRAIKAALLLTPQPERFPVTHIGDPEDYPNL